MPGFKHLVLEHDLRDDLLRRMVNQVSDGTADIRAGKALKGGGRK